MNLRSILLYSLQKVIMEPNTVLALFAPSYFAVCTEYKGSKDRPNFWLLRNKRGATCPVHESSGRNGGPKEQCLAGGVGHPIEAPVTFP
ncbi:hypothetical protein RB195_018362 [Necator americanus]|uniref:Secreted protein n=1 Tax=Necator americanus TaxID=51031 RepID=A0ABR1CBE9_NECAM